MQYGTVLKTGYKRVLEFRQEHHGKPNVEHRSKDYDSLSRIGPFVAYVLRHVPFVVHITSLFGFCAYVRRIVTCQAISLGYQHPYELEEFFLTRFVYCKFFLLNNT